MTPRSATTHTFFGPLPPYHHHRLDPSLSSSSFFGPLPPYQHRHRLSCPQDKLLTCEENWQTFSFGTGLTSPDRTFYLLLLSHNCLVYFVRGLIKWFDYVGCVLLRRTFSKTLSSHMKNKYCIAASHVLKKTSN